MRGQISKELLHFPKIPIDWLTLNQKIKDDLKKILPESHSLDFESGKEGHFFINNNVIHFEINSNHISYTIAGDPAEYETYSKKFNSTIDLLLEK
jgi:hypothetical protein